MGELRVGDKISVGDLDCIFCTDVILHNSGFGTRMGTIAYITKERTQEMFDKMSGDWFHVYNEPFPDEWLDYGDDVCEFE